MDSTDDVPVHIGGHRLPGLLLRAAGGGPARGLVIFAQGSGRLSPRTQFIARKLRAARLNTLVLDLLTQEEAGNQHNVFDIGLLVRRLMKALDWKQSRADLSHLPCGFFGASTGVAAALIAATQRPAQVQAIVSRCGRPDLAGEVLPEVQAPTLLIVGGADADVLHLNRIALARMSSRFSGEAQLEVVPGATHLLEEPGALEQVAKLGTAWFVRHFVERVQV